MTGTIHRPKWTLYRCERRHLRQRSVLDPHWKQAQSATKTPLVAKVSSQDVTQALRERNTPQNEVEAKYSIWGRATVTLRYHGDKGYM